MTNNVVVALGFTTAVAVIGGISLKFMKGRKAKTEEAPKSLKVLVQEAVAVKKYDEFKAELNIDSLPDKPTVIEETVPTEAVELLAEEIVEDKPVLHVSRMRVALAPVFWTHFESNIRRLEVIELTEEAFSDRSTLNYNRGWHKCTLNGTAGILHVTKQNISAVIFDGNEFHGISTSASRFGNRGMTNLQHDRVKAYLQGH